MKITLAIFALVLSTTTVTAFRFAKSQAYFSFFPDDDGQDNLKMESVAFTREEPPSSPIRPSPSESIEGSSTHTVDLDAIVTATREGRRLSVQELGLNFNDTDTSTRFDELLSDPSVKEKVASSSEVEARGFIHDKLCSLGLCDEGEFGGHHGHRLGSSAKYVQLVQPVALKPVGHPIPAVPLENKGKYHHGHGGHGLGGAYGRPPVPPPHPEFGHGGSGFGFGGSSGGLIPKRPAQQIFPGPAPGFRPNYGPPPPPPFLPITKPVNTHVHHHIHHNQPGGVDTGLGVGAPYLDGYYGAAGKSSLSVATPAGKALGTYPQAQTLTPSYTAGRNCVCVPAEQCQAFANGYEQSGSQNSPFVQGVGIPNNGLVGYGIDPRNLKNGHGIESNSTESESESAAESDIPESPKAEAGSRRRRDTGGFEGGLLDPTAATAADGESEPRQLNYNQNAPRNCQPGFVCCPNPYLNQGQGLAQTSATNNNLVDYSNGRFQQPHPQRQCGKRQTEGISGRVISGGNPSTFSVDGETNFGDYPWHVAILKDNGFVCSGSLIDSYHILTAAHCLKRLSANELKIRLGEWDVNHETEFYPFVETKVDSIIIHPEFYAGNLVNDVAILRLASSIDFPRNPHISPICLPPPNLDFAGRRCFVSGWGKDAFGAQGKFQNVLKEVDLPVLTHFDCEQKLKRTRLGRDFALDKGFVCAGGEANKDACKGDGGGGLVCDVNGSWYLAGIVSWGVGCGEVDVPGVYAKISEYTPWIQQNTGIIH